MSKDLAASVRARLFLIAKASQALWQAFHRKNAMAPRQLAEVVALLRERLRPALLKAAVSARG